MRETPQRVKAGFRQQSLPGVPVHAKKRSVRWGPRGKVGGAPPRPRLQRSQALIEFALISPVLLLLLFGIVDIGRAVFYFDTLSHAAREAARTAVRASNS